MTAEFAVLGELASFTNGAAFKASDWGDDGSRIIRIQNLTDPRKAFNRTLAKAPENVRVYPGDLLVSWSATLGVFEWAGPDVAVLNQHIFRVEADESKVDKQYLRFALAGVLLNAERHMHGATMKHVNKGDLLSTEIFLPSLAEQKMTAQLLAGIEALRAKRRRSVVLLADLSRSIFQNMFGDPLSNPKGWDRLQMKDILARIDSGRSPQCLDRPATLDEWGVLKLGAITQCVYVAEENKAFLLANRGDEVNEVHAGDLLFARKNTPDLVGASVYVKETPPRLLLPDLIFRLVVRDDVSVHKRYLHSLLTHPGKRRTLKRLASGSAASMSNISKAKLMEFECEIPPMHLQESFLTRLDSVDHVTGRHAAHLAQLDALFESVQHRAFRGELWALQPDRPHPC